MHPSLLRLTTTATATSDDEADAATIDAAAVAAKAACADVVGIITGSIGTTGITAKSSVETTCTAVDGDLTGVIVVGLDIHFAGSATLGEGQTLTAGAFALPGLIEQAIATAAGEMDFEFVSSGAVIVTDDALV